MPNAAHLHLILVHSAPTLLWISLLLLVFSAFFRNERGLHLVTLVVVLMATVGLVAAANSGEAASDLLTPVPGINSEAIHEHEELGETMFPFALASAFMVIIWFSLVRKNPEKVRGWAWWVSVLLVAGTAVFATIVSNVGGAIRHPEAHKGWDALSERQDPAVVDSVKTKHSGH